MQRISGNMVPAPADTRDKILAAAVRLFRTHGFGSVSVRKIAAAAQVNPALINYYYGRKLVLFAAAMGSLDAPINAERLRLLQQLTRAGQRQPSVEEVVAAWIIPAFRVKGEMVEKKATFVRLLTALMAEDPALFDEVVEINYANVNGQFLDVLERILPRQRRATLVWRLYCLIGSIIFVSMPSLNSMKSLSFGLSHPENTDELLRELIAFAAEGFRAAAPDADLQSPPSKRATAARWGPGKPGRNSELAIISRRRAR